MLNVIQNDSAAIAEHTHQHGFLFFHFHASDMILRHRFGFLAILYFTSPMPVSCPITGARSTGITTLLPKALTLTAIPVTTTIPMISRVILLRMIASIA
jgi:hypothetical protein